MTRSRSWSTGNSNGNSHRNQHMPHNYGKTTPDAGMLRMKKNGAGKANWGQIGDELEDIDLTSSRQPEKQNEFHFAHARRHSNAMNHRPVITTTIPRSTKPPATIINNGGRRNSSIASSFSSSSSYDEEEEEFMP